MPSLRSRIARLVIKYKIINIGDDDRPLALRRLAMERAARLAPMAPGVLIEPVMVGAVPGEWVTAPGAAADRVVLYLHGGSYVQGSPRTHRVITSRIAMASGARVLVLDYRLAPEHLFPAAVQDATAAYRWLLERDITPEHVAMAGDSAGGGLVIATAVALREAGMPLPAALVCISPWTDLEGTGESRVTRAKADPMFSPDGIAEAGRKYLGDADPRTPLASPIYSDLRGLPPLLIQVGNDEVLLSDATRLAERASAAGVATTLEIWPDMWHVWHAFAGFVPEARRALREIGEWVSKHCAPSPAPSQG